MQSKRGFTLIELSVVVLILSIMIGGILSVVTQNIRIEKNAEMKQKMDAIREALMLYAKVNKRLPCPSDITLAVNTANFGVEAEYTAGNCVDGSPAANYAAASNTVMGGGLPVKTLGLPYDYAFDAWNNRLFYAVDSTMASDLDPLPFIEYPPMTTPGNISILDREANSMTAAAIYAVISYGPNGHGAVSATGSARKSSNSTNTAEQKNCHCDSSAAATVFDNTFYSMQPFVSTTATSQYDDITIYATRANINFPEEMGVE